MIPVHSKYKQQEYVLFMQLLIKYFQGHRYLSPIISTDASFIFPLIPVGEWRFDVVVRKNINGSDEFILSFSIFYDIKPMGIVEF